MIRKPIPAKPSDSGQVKVRMGDTSTILTINRSDGIHSNQRKVDKAITDRSLSTPSQTRLNKAPPSRKFRSSMDRSARPLTCPGPRATK